ncbi:GMC family oxidoreductase [Leptospira ellisii]|uniref:Cholesterol oxidase n=1 Tax=Leptospira ellisii TaxID=2023197 RepID=A0A2N0BBA2_9LEPT|nr:GMC family oxidoreductase [Leptospira ellisii]MDV6236222.1 GMC family oxidoreductase [Leptospira ellisii]PJZ93812.1 choline dehydrogenase [Leptospira ellisii]PKA05683.1 choline dehydrogenase [Leptospira ellisii]
MSDNNSHYDAVVIGSGFGGSISALRLSEKGQKVLVLERGKKYPPGSFPRDVRQVDQLLWRYPKKRKSLGLYELNFFSGLGTVTASGLGGGSLIYANIHIRPDQAVFDDPRWPAPFNRKYLDPFYDKVAAKLDVKPVPAEWNLPKRNKFKTAAELNQHAYFDPDEAVSWLKASRPGQSVCQRCAECEFGCNHGAKNTLDFNYIADAQKNGAIFQTDSNVTHIAPDKREGYVVYYENTETGERRSVSAKRVVISAGTLGTHRILFNSRDRYKTLPGISKHLGKGYSGNGDFLGGIESSKTDLKPWDGPDVTTVINYFPKGFQFTMAAPTFNEPVMAVLASLGIAKPNWFLRLIGPLFWKSLGWILPFVFEKGLLSKPLPPGAPGAGDPKYMTNLFAIGRDNANGRIVRCGKNIDVRWNYSKENRTLIQNMTASMQQVGDAYGGQFGPLATFLLFNRILSVHSLGGCTLSANPDKGVVSETGEVFGYKNLFIADGSVIPSSIGFHPVMTISAVAEHTAASICAGL